MKISHREMNKKKIIKKELLIKNVVIKTSFECFDIPNIIIFHVSYSYVHPMYL